MLLQNGSLIKNDVIESFNKAVENPDNRHEGGGINWDFADADLQIDLGNIYYSEYLTACLDVLVDNYFDVAYDRLQVLKRDYLGLED